MKMVKENDCTENKEYFLSNCRKYAVHKVKVSTTKIRPGRTMAWGTRRHERKLRGHHGKVKGKVKVRKQSSRNKIMLECLTCRRNTSKSFPGG